MTPIVSSKYRQLSQFYYVKILGRIYFCWTTLVVLEPK
jgi:hypothetical protein